MEPIFANIDALLEGETRIDLTTVAWILAAFAAVWMVLAVSISTPRDLAGYAPTEAVGSTTDGY